jgi:hypothetical protein
LGGTYTVTGDYTHTNTNGAGCLNSDTLHLTINYGTHHVTSVAVCNSYTWSSGTGTTYTISGTYLYSYTNGVGCASKDTLNLIINHDAATSNSQIVCGSYVWFSTTYTLSGTYVHTYISGAGCLNSDTLHLIVNPIFSATSNVAANGFYTWNVNNVTYTVSGTYTVTLTTMAGCDSTFILNLTVTRGAFLAAKAILSGPFVLESGLMHDSLRVNGLIPLTEPYTSAPYNKMPLGGAAGETVSQSVLNVTGNNAIVDWVLLELRSSIAPSTVIANKRALIQRDGDIVSEDGVSPVFFAMNSAGNYFVSVKHRNHLGVMSLNALGFVLNATTNVNFTSTSPVYTNAQIPNSPRKLIGTINTLWSGDANNNKNTKYNGLSNDKDALIYVVGFSTPNNSINSVYRIEDVNLDGKIRYNNTDNDRVIILNNVGVSNPNTILYQHTPN